MKKQDSNIDNKQIMKINEKQINKIISFIINNRKVIDVYFFIGSGFLKYLLNGHEERKNLKINYLSWQEMFKKKFSYLDTDHFHDLTTVDFQYEKKIKKIIEFNDKQFEKDKIVNNENNGLKEFYNTIRNIIISDNKPENNNNNSIRFITTNHCNTINKYFEIYDKYYLENLYYFLKENFSILNIHNKNKNEFIYKIEHYVDLFSQKNENKENYFYINEILELADSIKDKDQEIKRKKIFFLFGTSFSELHLNVFINKIKSSDHPIVWFRDISQIIRKTNIKSSNKEVLFKNLKKFLQEQEKKYFWHIFLKPEEFDNLFKIFNKKLKKELLKYINFSYEYIPHRKFDEKYFSELTNIKRKILEDYQRRKYKKGNLKKKSKEKNYDYIGTVLSENEENEIAINWYFENIELFEKTPININWFLTLWVLGNNKLRFADKLINTCIKNNNDYNIDILVWIKHAESIEENKWELIINIVWNRLLLIDANNWTLNRIAKYDNEQQKLDVKNKKKHSNSLKLLVIEHVKKTYKEIIFVEAFFNLYWLKKITNLDFDIIEIIKTATKKEINKIFYNCNFGIYLNNLRISYSKICILAFQKYFKTNLDQLEELINDLKNSDDFLKMSYILDKNEFDNSYIKMFENRSKELDIDSKELQKPFDINDYLSDFDKKLSGFLSKFVKEKTDLKKLESNIDECLESIKEETWFSKMDFFRYIGNIFNEIIINKKDNELIEKMNNLIIQYNEKICNKNNYFVTYDERYEELELDHIVNVICDLNKKKIEWFSKTLIMTFAFNCKLRPDFDFYMIKNKNFSLITLLSKLNKEKIDLQNIFNENEDQELIKIYLDIFNKPHENFKNENYLFLKFFYDVYTEKESENSYIPWFKEEKINKNFFEFLEKWCLVKQDFYPIIYFLFISKIIQYCQTNFAIDLILSKENINIYKKANCEYFFYWIDDILKKAKKQKQNNEEIEKLLTKFIKNIDFENIKILIPQLLDKEKYWKCLRNINKFIKQNNKPDLVKNSEINWFTEEVFEYIWLIIEDNDPKYINSLYNLFLSMLFFYKLEENNNPEEKKWNLIFNTLKEMKNLINLKELKKLKEIVEVEDFIKEAKKLT